jgi:hypothetical protein
MRFLNRLQGRKKQTMLRKLIITVLKNAEGPLSIRRVWENVVLDGRFQFTTREQISMAGPTRTKLRVTGLHVDVYDELTSMEKDGIVRMIRPRDTGKKRGTTFVSLI